MHVPLSNVSSAPSYREAAYRPTGWGAFLSLCLTLCLLGLTGQAQNGPTCDQFSSTLINNSIESPYFQNLRCVVVDGNKVYTGGNEYGLSISADGGRTFAQKTIANGLGSNLVNNVFVVGNTVYAATASGMSISTDGGQTFVNKSIPGPNGDYNVVCVYVVGSTLYVGTNGSLAISTDGGNTYTHKTSNDNVGYTQDVRVVGNTVYAATYSNGLLISTDGGQTFVSRTTADGLGSNTVNKVYVSGSTVYAATNGGLSISTNGGQTFTNKTTANGLPGNYVGNLFVLGSTVYTSAYNEQANSTQLAISTDAGNSFTSRTIANGLIGNVFAMYATLEQLYAVSTNYVGDKPYSYLAVCKKGLTVIASATPTAMCVGSPASLSVDVSSGTTPYSYTWVAPVGVTLSATNTKMVSATPTATGVQTLTVLVADASSPALSASATVDLTVNGTPDYLPLLDLYNATNGPNWKNKTGWLSSCDPCNRGDGRPWQGIGCRSGRVTNLELGNNQLSGSIPASLSALTGLTDIQLQGNQLTGSIPSSLSALTNLRSLFLNANQLSGRIPVSLSALTNLSFLVLDNNLLSGSIPDSFSALTNLVFMSLHDNQLSGSIPDSFNALTKLATLTLNNNQLSGSIPASLSALTNLESLNVAYNQLSGSIPASLSALTKLQKLISNNNQLSGSIPDSFSALTNLKEITSFNNQLSGSLPASLSALTNLENLNLSYNQLSGSVPASLSALTKLQSLFLNNNQLSGSIPAGLGTLPALTFLRLNRNQLSGCLAAALKALCGKSVDISNNPGLPAGGDWTAFCSGALNGNCVITLQTSATPNPVFAGSTATLSVTPSGATDPYSYTWTAPPGVMLDTPSQPQTQAQIPAGTSGVLTFTITVADATPIYSTSLVTLTVTAASPATQTACRNGRVVLNSGVLASRYEWYRGGKTVANRLIEVRSVQQGTTTSSLTLVSVQTNATYYCKAFAANGSFEWAGPFALTMSYNCGGRMGAQEPGVGLQVSVAPNPLEGGWLRASITGVAGQPLQVQVMDLTGKSVRAQEWSAAEADHRFNWDLSAQPGGVYLLQVRTQEQAQTLRIIKP